MTFPVQGLRSRSAAPIAPPGLRLLFACLAVSILASASPGRDEALRLMARKIDGPQDLGNGLTLLHGRAEGGIWFQAISSDTPLKLPSDAQFRAMLRDRCADEELGALMARGAIVQEARSFGPHQVHVFTLTLSSKICDQVRLE